jgi:type I restriction enzyme S subunit
MNWKKAKISQLIEEFERGISYTSEEILDPTGIPMMNLACIDKTGFYRDGEMKFYSGKYAEEDLVYPNEMLIACTDLTRNADIIGTPIMVPCDNDFYLFTMDLAKLTTKPCIDKMFLYYALKTSTYRKYIKKWATGTTVLHLNLRGVYDYELWYPEDLEDQKKLSILLSALDRKIALNRQINQNLEALARQLYDYWFVQFDFPDANGKPYKSSGGKMVYNPILKREIPAGWEVKEIGAILDKVKSSMKLTTNEFSANGKYPIIDQATDTYYAGFTDREDAVLDQYPAVVFGDHSCAVKYVNFPFVRGADGTQVMISKEPRISTEYLYFAVKDVKIGKGYARHYSFLKSSLIIVPSQELALEFQEQAGKLFNQITLNRKQILSLTKQRDELLPLLMNGQVTVE